MNIEPLLKVKEQILKHPETFDINNWECKTTKCLAGWICKFADIKVGINNGYIFYASSILNLSKEEANKLFLLWHWPNEFKIRYNNAKQGLSSETEAEVTAERIDYFIKINGE